MGHRDQTREALLEVGRRFFLEKGYRAAGLDAVLKAASVPKGSFYHYFPSKEEFGLAVLDSFARESAEAIEAALGDRDLGPMERLRRYFEGAIGRFEDGHCRSGCLIGKLSSEMAEQSEAFRARLCEVLGRWTDCIASCLAEAQQAGELRSDIDPNAFAQLLADGWQGALLRAKTLQCTEPLRTFLDVMFGSILREPSEVGPG